MINKENDILNIHLHKSRILSSFIFTVHLFAISTIYINHLYFYWKIILLFIICISLIINLKKNPIAKRIILQDKHAKVFLKNKQIIIATISTDSFINTCIIILRLYQKKKNPKNFLLKRKVYNIVLAKDAISTEDARKLRILLLTLKSKHKIDYLEQNKP